MQYTLDKCDLVFYPSAPLMGDHSAKPTSLLEAMFHKYMHISQPVSISNHSHGSGVHHNTTLEEDVANLSKTVRATQSRANP